MVGARFVMTLNDYYHMTEVEIYCVVELCKLRGGGEEDSGRDGVDFR